MRPDTTRNTAKLPIILVVNIDHIPSLNGYCYGHLASSISDWITTDRIAVGILHWYIGQITRYKPSRQMH